MGTSRIIYWRPDLGKNEKGEMYANIHLLVGYNQGTIADFQAMANELRKTFPQATDDQIRGGKVFKSSSVDGHTIIAWDAYIPNGDYPEWRQNKDGRVEYCW